MNYKSSVSKKTIFLACIAVVFLSLSCRTKIPVKEMVLSKLNITEAENVKADKYAPEELKKAKEALLQSQTYLKADDAKAAKKSAEESLEYSDAAITKALPLLADDILKDARKTYEEANTAYAEKYAGVEFNLSGEKIEESETQFINRQYRGSYSMSNEAIDYATKARDKALSNIPALKDDVRRIGDEEKKLELMGGRDLAPEELKIIDASLPEASQLIETKNLKAAFAKITEADTALKSADLKTWKAFASGRIKSAEEAYQKADASPSKAEFAGDIGKAGRLIAESKSLFDKESYRESGIKSDEAIAMLNIIISAEEKAQEKKEEERIAKQETEEKTEEETGEESQIGPAKGVLAEYVVKYNPKNRDCLWKIAMISYKDARLWPLIYVANKDQIKDPDLIFPGQKLIIPPVPAVAEIKKSKLTRRAEKEAGQ